MRQILFIISCFFALAMPCQGQMIVLQHNGMIANTYTGDSLPKAIESAAEGDTLYLSEGHYYQMPTIDKSIAIIGVGASKCTISNEGPHIYIQPKTNGSIKQITIEGVTLNVELCLDGNIGDKIENINITKSVLHGFFSGINTTIENATFESCNLLSKSCFQGELKNLNFRNCEISYGEFLESSSLAKVTNCDIVVVSGASNILCINSIIGQVGLNATEYLSENNILINTLYQKFSNYDPAKNCVVQDCYTTENTLTKGVGDEWGSNNKLTITEEELRQNNYLGSDSTIIGKSGGGRPFSLDMHLPAITKSKYTMDNSNKKVSINVTVTAN